MRSVKYFPSNGPDKDNVLVSGNCVITGKYYEVKCSKVGFHKWEDGELIQNALPELSLDDREFLISGISPEGWKEQFGEEDE